MSVRDRYRRHEVKLLFLVVLGVVAYLAQDAAGDRSRLAVVNERQTRNFCMTEFDGRDLMADTLSIIAGDDASGEADTQEENERERRIADAIEERLRYGLPKECLRYVDPSELRIQVGASDRVLFTGMDAGGPAWP